MAQTASSLTRYLRWIPSLTIMALLFRLSSGPVGSFDDSYWTNFAIMKTIHVCVYMTLTLTYIYALRGHGYTLRVSARYAVYLSLAYAISDELHQTTVPTRTGTVRDILIDLAGAMCVYWLVRTHYAQKALTYLAQHVRPRPTQ